MRLLSVGIHYSWRNWGTWSHLVEDALNQSRAGTARTCVRYQCAHRETAHPQWERPKHKQHDETEGGKTFAKADQAWNKRVWCASREATFFLAGLSRLWAHPAACEHQHLPRLLKQTVCFVMLRRQKPHKSWGLPLTHTCFNNYFFKDSGLSDCEYYPMRTGNTVETGNF